MRWVKSYPNEVWCDCEGRIWLGIPVQSNRNVLMMNADTGRYFVTAWRRSDWRRFGWKKLGMEVER